MVCHLHDGTRSQIVRTKRGSAYRRTEGRQTSSRLRHPLQVYLPSKHSNARLFHFVAMSDLALLPSEILHVILGYIFDPTFGAISGRYHALAGLARPCRALNPISTQYLYGGYESPLERPIAGFLRRFSDDRTLYRKLKHINVLLHTGPVQRPRPRRQLVANMTGLPELYRALWTAEVNNSLAARNEIELAVMVLQATKLESIVMQKGAKRAVRTFDNLNEPPFWLLPLSNAGVLHRQAQISTNTCLQLPYQSLHSLTLDIQHCNHHSLTHLFSLPALRKLHLRNLLDHAFLRWLRDGGGWENLNTYPDPSPWPALHTAHSTVTSLSLENVKIPTSNIVWTISTCKELRCFSVTGEGNGDVVVSESRRWCVNILEALKMHRYTLRDLRLDPDLVHPLLADGVDEWACIQEFKYFTHLRHLDTMFSNLFGHPFEHVEGGGEVFDFLLQRCETLRIRFDGVVETNVDEVLLGSLYVDTPLKNLEIYYHCGNMFLNGNLLHPVNFWDVREAF